MRIAMSQNKFQDLYFDMQNIFCNIVLYKILIYVLRRKIL